ncbi:MAG TPA: Smr/MutS family protein [Azonexus sp.]|nr:Smr/MutS family protein [Azonexus sp.]
MSDAEDLAAFRAAVADVQPLPPVNRVEIAKARPEAKRLRRPADAPEPAIACRHKHREPALPAHWHDAGAAHPVFSDPEQQAFHAAMAGVQPIPSTNRAQLGGPTPPPRPRQFINDERAALHESLHGQIGLQDRLEGGDEPHYLRDGLAASVLRDLRRGRWVIQAELDLHGLNRDDARLQLATFLAECLHHGQRCVRVIHGKGHGSPQKLSILRQLVRGWLAQRQEILAYCQARPHDGGEGALIVLLRATKK